MYLCISLVPRLSPRVLIQPLKHWKLWFSLSQMLNHRIMGERGDEAFCVSGQFVHHCWLNQHTKLWMIADKYRCRIPLKIDETSNTTQLVENLLEHDWIPPTSVLLCLSSACDRYHASKMYTIGPIHVHVATCMHNWPLCMLCMHQYWLAIILTLARYNRNRKKSMYMQVLPTKHQHH